MAGWKRNYSKEALAGSKDKPVVWWTLSRPLFSGHVFNRNDGDGWHWKIYSATQKQGTGSFDTKEQAFTDCEKELVKMLKNSQFTVPKKG